MTSLSRRRLLGAAAGGAAFLAFPVRPALGASDDDLAYANFSVSGELLLADLYDRAITAQVVTGSAAGVLRLGRRSARQHANALSELLAGAGQQAPAPEDFDFQWPEQAFTSAAAIRVTTRDVLRALLGAYQTAVATVSEPSYRVLYASLSASVGAQLGALAVLGADGVIEPFPAARDLESASAAVDSYLG